MFHEEVKSWHISWFI